MSGREQSVALLALANTDIAVNSGEFDETIRTENNFFRVTIHITF
jgi:hypothetical protein